MLQPCLGTILQQEIRGEKKKKKKRTKSVQEYYCRESSRTCRIFKLKISSRVETLISSNIKPFYAT